MGKKKSKTTSKDPNILKEAGNKEFLAKNFKEAVELYTSAIELSLENPNAVYFSNRANAKLELFDFQGCIDDCDEAIKIDKSYVKSYLRKAKALTVLGRF